MGRDKSEDTIDHDQISFAWHRWFKLVLMIFYPEWRSVGHGGCYWWPDQLRQANDTDIVCEGVSMIHNNCWCDVEWNFWSALRRSFCLGRHCQLMLHSLYISCLSDAFILSLIFWEMPSSRNLLQVPPPRPPPLLCNDLMVVLVLCPVNPLPPLSAKLWNVE